MLRINSFHPACSTIGENTVYSTDFCPDQSTEVLFASFLSGGFTTMAVMNPLEKKLAKRTFVQSGERTNVSKLKST
jgi:hypothetical protein